MKIFVGNPHLRVSVLYLIGLLMTPLLAFTSSAILPAHLLLKESGVNAADHDTSQSRNSASKSNSARRLPGGSTSFQRMRPAPSSDLPILPLSGYPDSRDSLPSEADRDPGVLEGVLGSDFDSAFASVTRPVESVRHPNGTYEYDVDVTSSVGGDVRRLNSAVRLGAFTLPGFGAGAKLQATQRNRSRSAAFIQIKSASRRHQFERYLAAYTACPVLFKWKDLGERFWPRWLREGYCGGSGGGGGRRQTCSMPAGMTCKPQESNMKTVLWWHCKRSAASGKRQCAWISIKYPVIVKCQCAC